MKGKLRELPAEPDCGATEASRTRTQKRKRWTTHPTAGKRERNFVFVFKQDHLMLKVR